MSNKTRQKDARQSNKRQRRALRFLSNIYMSSSNAIETNQQIDQSNNQVTKLLRLPSVEEFLHENVHERDFVDPDQDHDHDHDQEHEHEHTNAIRIGGKKYQYQRRPAPILADVPNSNKRNELQLREWKRDAIANGLHRGRLFLSAQSSYPVLCFSVLNYDASTEKEAKRKREVLRLASEKGRAGLHTVGKRGRHGVSYIDLLGGSTNNMMNGSRNSSNTIKSNNKNNNSNNSNSNSSNNSNNSNNNNNNNNNNSNSNNNDSNDSNSNSNSNNNDSNIKGSLNNATIHVANGSNPNISGTAALSALSKVRKHHSEIGSVHNYDPNWLDDGTIKQGKSRLITSGPSHRHSFLPYVKRRDLKDEINAQFRELHPWLPTSMSLSKIRTLKRESLEQWKKHDLELSTLALGIVYFERLVIKTLVMKTNRKLKFAACLLLAYKFNEGESNDEDDTDMDINMSGSSIGNVKGNSTNPASTGPNTYPNHHNNHHTNTNGTVSLSSDGPCLVMQHVFDSIEHALGISRKELFRIELQVFAELDFHLSIPSEKLMPHFLRLLDTIDVTPKEYLGGKRSREMMRDMGYEVEDEEEEEEEVEEIIGGGRTSNEDLTLIYSDVSDAVIL